MFKKILLSFAFVLAGLFSFSHDYLLLPDDFFIAKGSKFVVHLFAGNDMKDLGEQKFRKAEISRFELIEGGKKTGLMDIVTEGLSPVLSRASLSPGLALVLMDRSSSENELDKEKFTAYLQDEGLSKILNLVEPSSKATFKEKSTRYLKTLICVEKPSGSPYSERTGQELEIVLAQNPYKMQYGDDMTAQVIFQGNPLKNAPVHVQTKALNGSVFTTDYWTDSEGKVYFKLNRAGTWVVRLVHMQPCIDGSADFQSWCGSFSFGFR